MSLVKFHLNLNAAFYILFNFIYNMLARFVACMLQFVKYDKKIKWAGPLGFAGVGSNPDVAGQVSGTPAKRKEFGVCRTYFQGAGYALRDYFGKKEVNYLQKQKLHRSLKLSYVCGSLETR